MLKAILVDDERPALQVLELLLQNFNGISVIGAFTNPYEALEKIGQLKPDVVFLDICIPQLQGLDLASLILEGSPDTNIVFVTAYDHYAVKAFELDSLDYILKPVSLGRLRKTVERMEQKQKEKKTDFGQRLQIKCLGQFVVGWENSPPIKWRAEKTKELFAFLLQNKARKLSKEELLEALWTDEIPDKAIRQLYNDIYYIRKALKEYGIAENLISIDSSYRVRLGDVDYDAECFYKFENRNQGYCIDGLKELVQLYAGDYLGSEYYEWANGERERLLRVYLNLLFLLADELSKAGRWEEAETCLLKAYVKNPYDEKATKLLLNVYFNSGNAGKALKHYRAYEKLLKNDLAIAPAEQIRNLMERFK